MAACSPTPVKRDPAYAAVRPIPVQEAPRTDGSIFNVSNNVSYFEDYRARRVGDILTVQLDEKTTAEKESATKIAKSNNNSVTTPTLMGAALQFNAPGFIPLDSNVNNNGEFALSRMKVVLMVKLLGLDLMVKLLAAQQQAELMI